MEVLRSETGADGGTEGLWRCVFGVMAMWLRLRLWVVGGMGSLFDLVFDLLLADGAVVAVGRVLGLGFLLAVDGLQQLVVGRLL